MVEKPVDDEFREIEKLALDLSDAIQRSEEYKFYRQCLQTLKQNPELYARVNVMRKQNFMLQNSNENNMSFDKFSDVASEFRKLRENPIVNNFLNSEIGLSKLVQNINEKIVIGIDFDGDFLD